MGAPTPTAPRRSLKMNVALFLLAAAVLMGAGVVIAITWGGVAPIPEISVEGELSRAATTLNTYPTHQPEFAGTAPWPKNDTEFSDYLTWLKTHAPTELANFSTQVTYHNTPTGPCLEVLSPDGPWHQYQPSGAVTEGSCKTTA